MTRKAMGKVLDRLAADREFRRYSQEEPFSALGGYELAPRERDQLLDKAAEMNRPRSPAHELIMEMVAARRFGGEEWRFREMSLAKLLLLAWAAGRQGDSRSAVHPRIRDVFAEADARGEPADTAVSRLTQADWREILAATRRCENFPGYRPPAECTDADKTLAEWRQTEGDWAQSLLAELEARRIGASDETLADLGDASMAVRRFLREVR